MALFDAFLKIEGIKGESADSKHKGEIDIMSFSWGVSQAGTFGAGGGGGAGKVKFNDFTITKKVDSSSPLLMLNCASGVHIKEASFVVRKAGGTQLEYLKIKMTDVLVSSVQPTGAANPVREAANTSGQSNAVLIGLLVPAVSPAAGAAQGAGDAIPMESVSLNFSKIEYSYQMQGKDGAPQGGPILAGWDVKQNKKV